MDPKRLFTLLLCFLSLSLSSQKKNPTPTPVTVYVFLSETCPICQNYTLTLKALYEKYKNKDIHFIGVFPDYYSTKKSIAEFKRNYAIPFDLVLDKKWLLINRFKASITPEVFVEDAGRNVIYSGRIDDSFFAVGKRRTMITSNELADVLAQVAQKKAVTVPKTRAVGCIIDASK